MNFRETALYYTDYKKKTDSTCKSKSRCYIDMFMQVALSEIRSKNKDMIETLVFTNDGDEAKNKVSQLEQIFETPGRKTETVQDHYFRYVNYM